MYDYFGNRGEVTFEKRWGDGKYEYFFNVINETYESVEKMYAFFKKRKFIKISDTSSKIQGAVSYPELDAWVHQIGYEGYKSVTVNIDYEEGFNGQCLGDTRYTPPNKIKFAPLEVVENEHTYRFISSANGYSYGITIISRDDDKYYNYLDKGHYIFIPKAESTGDRIVIASRYDINTAKIFLMCYFQPELADLLQDECFVHHNSASLLSLKMEKKLRDEYKTRYKEMSEILEENYTKHVSSATVRAFVSGESENLVLNNIKFTQNSAEYENIKIEADGLLQNIKPFLLGNTEFDIYSLIDYYTAALARQYNNYFPIKSTPEHEENPDQLVSFRKVKVNNLDVDLQRSFTGYSRYINGIRVMKDDIAAAISRAACYRDQEKYNLFLKSISRMSLRWHDVISNGLRMKICFMTPQDLKNPEPGKNFPSLKFAIDPETKKINLIASNDRKISINFAKFVKKVESINRRTDGAEKRKRGYYSYYRDHHWAIKRIIEALLDCCKNPNDLSNEDVVNLLSEANQVRDVALGRSRDFLNSAIRTTGAEEITFNGQRAYKVKGSLRNYAVVVSTAKVYDYETKQYRCIVNDQHYVGTGYDDIAARLLALKNDSLTQYTVNTLHGSAQPGAEQHHKYNPLRDNSEVVFEVVQKLMPVNT